MKNISLKIPDETGKRLYDAASEERRSVNNLITLIIEQWLAERKTNIEQPVDYPK